MILNGFIFILTLLTLIEITKIKPLNKTEKLMILVCILSLLLFLVIPEKETVFLIILSGSVLALLHQTFETVLCCVNKIRNKIEVKLIVFYLLSNVFWTIYGYRLPSFSLFIISLISSFNLMLILILWIINVITSENTVYSAIKK